MPTKRIASPCCWQAWLAVAAVAVLATTVQGQGLRSSTSQVSLVVVKRPADEAARTTRDFVGRLPAWEAHSSVEAIDVQNLPPGVSAFIRAATGRLIRLGSDPITVDPNALLFTRLQGSEDVLRGIAHLQLSVRGDDGKYVVIQLNGATPPPAGR